MAYGKPMREVSKDTPKAGGDGAPSSLKNKTGSKGHKQTQGSKPKSAEADMAMQTMKNRQLENADPFRLLMEQSSRNARYTMPLAAGMGAPVDPGDITNITKDEHKNMPRSKRAG